MSVSGRISHESAYTTAAIKEMLKNRRADIGKTKISTVSVLKVLIGVLALKAI